MIPKDFSPRLPVVFGVLALVLLVTGPMGHALEIHHLFGEADHDGHQHSDFDLCQWVQSHTAGSLVGEEPTWGTSSYLFGTLPAFSALLLTTPCPLPYVSRGPPSSLLI